MELNKIQIALASGEKIDEDVRVVGSNVLLDLPTSINKVSLDNLFNDYDITKGTLEKRLGQIQTDLNIVSLETRLISLEEMAESLNLTVASLEREIAGFETGAAALNTRVSALEEKCLAITNEEINKIINSEG